MACTDTAGGVDGPTWISLHRVQTWAFQRITEELGEGCAMTWFVVRHKTNRLGGQMLNVIVKHPEAPSGQRVWLSSRG